VLPRQGRARGGRRPRPRRVPRHRRRARRHDRGARARRGRRDLPRLAARWHAAPRARARGSMTNPSDTVLVVEDEAPMRRFLRAALTSHGFKVVEAATARDAEQLATETPPDAVLLDLGLPDADGIELLHKLREWLAAPVIVLSAREREDDK